MALYNDVRPQTWDEVFGQDEAVAMLKSVVAIPEAQRPKVFLLEGAYGCGKTTLTSVFARAIGVNPDRCDYDVLDGSKDRSVDNVRTFTGRWGTQPMRREAQGRVFVIDECHSLQGVACEALLKKCEDTPVKTYVFFCTTEGGKMPKPLRSRCKVIPIKPMTPKAIYQNLLFVAKKVGINLKDEDAQTIARNSDSSARVSLQILENYNLNGGNAEKAIALQKGGDEKLVADTYSLCRMVIDRRATWSQIAEFCRSYQGQDEPVRIAILNYLNSCLLNSRSDNDRRRFTALIECFIEPMFYAGKAGLTYMLSNSMDVK